MGEPQQPIGCAMPNPSRRWHREPQGDGSLVFRHAPSGCTLQNVSEQKPPGYMQFSDRWLLFSADRILLASLRGGSGGSLPPFAAAEEELEAGAALFERPAALGCIDYAGCYSLR